MTRRARQARDEEPERIHYRDDGCSVHPACLTCPLPACRFDVEDGQRQADQHAAAAGRQRAIRELIRVEHVSATQAAQQLGISRRTVNRALALAQAESGEGE